MSDEARSMLIVLILLVEIALVTVVYMNYAGAFLRFLGLI